MLVLIRIDFEEVVENDENHGCRAKEYGKTVELRVCDHGVRLWAVLAVFEAGDFLIRRWRYFCKVERCISMYVLCSKRCDDTQY